MTFYDIESGEYITLETLYSEYLTMQKEQPDEYNYSFTEYINNCLTVNNGTLEKIQ